MKMPEQWVILVPQRRTWRERFLSWPWRPWEAWHEELQEFSFRAEMGEMEWKGDQAEVTLRIISDIDSPPPKP